MKFCDVVYQDKTSRDKFDSTVVRCRIGIPDTCHENVLVSGDEEVQQVRVAHAVHSRDDQLAKFKLRVVPGEAAPIEVGGKREIRGDSKEDEP